jgi:hypothetical protein
MAPFKSCNKSIPVTSYAHHVYILAVYVSSILNIMMNLNKLHGDGTKSSKNLKYKTCYFQKLLTVANCITDVKIGDVVAQEKTIPENVKK